ncbi:MAG: hypothetical protein BWY21_00728 [Parcubacteria group bacterium ADurb.Bin216]|nr:MAG: hypothetical protein BWY21_00728 [Parcubacteria group bacterium ADurb.Bin216]
MEILFLGQRLIFVLYIREDKTMPEYGLKVQNNKQEIQIDSLYKNYVNILSGSYSGAAGFQTYTFTPSKFAPVIAIRPKTYTTSGIVLWSVTYSGGYYTGFVIGGGPTAGGTNAIAYDYKVFVLDPNSISTISGIRIRNKKMETVYDSGYKPLKIYNQESVTIPTVGTGQTTYTHNSYLNPFYILSPLHQGYIGMPRPVQGPIYIFICILMYASSTSVKLAWSIIYQGITNVADSWQTGTSAKIILCE